MDAVYIVAVFLCIVQAFTSAFSFVWHRRYALMQLNGNRIIFNKVVAIGCLLAAAGIMIFCTSYLPITLYCCLCNFNMVFVCILAYFILGEKINMLQILALISLVVSSTLAAIAVRPSLYDKTTTLAEQDALGKESVKSTSTIVFLSLTFAFQIGCFIATFRQQYRIRKAAESKLKQMQSQSIPIPSGISERDIARVSRTFDPKKLITWKFFLPSDESTTARLLERLGVSHDFANSLSYYVHFVMAIHLVAYFPSMNAVLIKFSLPLFSSKIATGWINWFSIFAVIASWLTWVLTTGWLVTCFNASLATPILYGSQSLYGIILGVIVMQETPQMPIMFSICASWMVLSSVIFALVRDVKPKEDPKTEDGDL